MSLRSFCFIFCFFMIQIQSAACLSGEIHVIASIYPLVDMVRQVGGDNVDVTFVLPAGASPHTFEPKPSLVKKFSSARIFFMVGAGLEFWAEKFIELAGPDLTTVVLSEGISLIHTAGHYHDGAGKQHHEYEAANQHKGVVENHIGLGMSDHKPRVANPHIWLDPMIAKSIVHKITAALCEVDHPHATYYRKRGQRYLEKLDGLDQMVQKTVLTFSLKKYVSFHASWDYFAGRYGLEPVGVIEAAPGRNPTPIQIKNIAAMIKKYHIRAVFAEPQLNPRAAEVIAREAQVKVLLLDPLGGPSLKGRNTYIDLIKFNLEVMQEAMK
jgi:zinc transport system substrate-binding protein